MNLPKCFSRAKLHIRKEPLGIEPKLTKTGEKSKGPKKVETRNKTRRYPKV